MSKLHSDYTTPEQSKRLLELGVPADSADIVYYNTPDSLYDPYIITEQSQIQNIREGVGTPCWSVGRLIEILEIIVGTPWSDYQVLGKSTLLERVLRDFEDVVKFKKLFKDNRIDFSKLEE